MKRPGDFAGSFCLAGVYGLSLGDGRTQATAILRADTAAPEHTAIFRPVTAVSEQHTAISRIGTAIFRTHTAILRVSTANGIRTHRTVLTRSGYRPLAVLSICRQQNAKKAALLKRN